MAGYKRNQDSFQASNSNNNINNLITTNSSEAQQTKRQRSENNDYESICWKYFEPFEVPKENGTITKCTVPGCTTRYSWCGSTSNLSSGLINPQIELPLEKQINKVYERLFLQLKLKAQQANSVMLSIDHIYIEEIEEYKP
ncbi:12741_t:CDS:2, partial [Dentiscutata heterogama]